MKKKTIALIIIALVFIFPFRMVFLEYPENIKVNETMIDGGRGLYVFYFLLTIIGFLAFMILSISDGHKEAEEKRKNIK